MFCVGKYKNLQTVVAGGTSLLIALRFLQTQKIPKNTRSN